MEKPIEPYQVLATAPELQPTDYGNVKRVGLCVPMRGHIDAAFMQSYLQIFLFFMKQPGVVPVPLFSEGMPLDSARNDIVRAGIIQRIDYYFWLDADIFMNEQSVQTLWDSIQQPSIDMISGIYYERAPPYNPVLRRESDFGKMRCIDDYPQDRIFQADGIGFGCVMMKKKPMIEMVNKHKGKVFQFSKECSEDLFFCRRVRELGYKIWVNPSVQCSHGGAPVSAWHYLHYKMDEYADMKELSDFTKENPIVVYRKAADAEITIAAEWKAKFADRKDIPQNELDEFYRDVDYRYDLTHYWSRNRSMREHVLDQLPALCEQEPGMCVLDYGCGIGDYGLSVLEDTKEVQVTFFDINKLNLEYLKWRIDQRNILDPLYRVADKIEAIPADKRFKLVFCFDMLEHVAQPEYHLAWIRDHMTIDGTLMAFVAPLNDTQPQHVSKCVIEDHGFMKTGDYTWIRDDSPNAIEYRRQIANLVIPTAKRAGP